MEFLMYFYGFLVLTVVASLVFAGYKVRGSKVRLDRSVDPIRQKTKALKIEVSALKRSRLDRQRRLESTDS